MSYREMDDQVEMIKKFWNQHGNIIVIAFCLIIGGNLLYQAWRSHTQEIQNKASVGYEQLLVNLENRQATNVVNQAEYLMANFPQTSYAPMARMILANLNIKEKKYDKAFELLNWVMAHAKESPIKELARVRIAALLYQQGNYQSAIRMLEDEKQSSYQAISCEILGDCYQALHQLDQAKKYYQQSLDLIDQKSTHRQIVAMKYQDVLLK